MEVLRNGEVIGYSNYYFEHNDKKMDVKNYTKFKVELFGVTIFSVSSEAIEKLSAIRPQNLGQAMRISGITPADISVLSIYVSKNKGFT